MPGENLQKLNKEELEDMRNIVRWAYFVKQGWGEREMKAVVTERELDKLIDSLNPETIDELREMGLVRGIIKPKLIVTLPP